MSKQKLKSSISVSFRIFEPQTEIKNKKENELKLSELHLNAQDEGDDYSRTPEPSRAPYSPVHMDISTPKEDTDMSTPLRRRAEQCPLREQITEPDHMVVDMFAESPQMFQKDNSSSDLKRNIDLLNTPDKKATFSKVSDSPLVQASPSENQIDWDNWPVNMERPELTFREQFGMWSDKDNNYYTQDENKEVIMVKGGTDKWKYLANNTLLNKTQVNQIKDLVRSRLGT